MQNFVNGNSTDMPSFQGNPDVKPLERDDLVRLIRLILEALEVSLHLCNSFLKSFGPSRVREIIVCIRNNYTNNIYKSIQLHSFLIEIYITEDC